MLRRTIAALALCFVFAQPTTILIVRHAEKAANQGDDPHLSDAGAARAQALADVARHAHVSAAYVTEFQRTHETAAPLHVPMIEVPVKDLNHPGDYAQRLATRIARESAGKTVLVVSHGNIVPDLVKALAGVSVSAIGNDEYSRLYVVSLPQKSVIAAQYGCR
jgi:broad specificity phosphatase PhoE